MFSDMCCLEDNAPGTVRQTQWLDPFNNLTVRSVQTRLTHVTANTLEILCFIAFIAKQ